MFWLFQSINKESPEISFGSFRSVRMFSIWSFLQQPTVLVEARNLAWPWSGESRKAGADTNFHLFRKRSPVSPRNSPVDWAKKPFLIYIPTGISIKLCFPEGKYRENKVFSFRTFASWEDCSPFSWIIQLLWFLFSEARMYTEVHYFPFYFLLFAKPAKGTKSSFRCLPLTSGGIGEMWTASKKLAVLAVSHVGDCRGVKLKYLVLQSTSNCRNPRPCFISPVSWIQFHCALLLDRNCSPFISVGAWKI